MKINGHTKQLGIIGCPVEHSFSPGMHNFISDYLGNNYVYSPWLVKPSELADAVKGIRALGIAGVNVTAPHKVAVMQYLDEISDSARMLGSVNTIVNRNGKLCGYNTDSEGFYKALHNAGIEIKGKKILILGAGGVVKPTLMRIIQEKPESVTVFNRTKSRVFDLAKKIKEQMDFDILTTANVLDFDIVINTTSAGMEPQTGKLPIDEIEEIDSLDFINEKTSVVDMIYNPDKTLFLEEAQKRGAKTVNGLGMLINQGLIAYELFTGEKLSQDMEETVKKEVFER